MKQVVYVDVLFALNMLVSFMLIKSAVCLCREKSLTWRVLAGSLLGGIYSMCIFLPPLNPVFTFAARVVFLLAVCFCVFGFGRARRFFRCFAVLCAVTLLFAGAIVGVYLFVGPQAIYLNNGAFYADISFLSLVLGCASLYAVVRLFSAFLSRKNRESSEVLVMLSYNGKTVRAKGIIDTGNRLHDSFTGKPVSVIDRTLALSLLPVEYAAAAMNPSGINLPLGMHLIVSETVGGKTLMTAFDVDEMRIIMPETEFVLKKASIAISTSTDFGTGCSVLLSADILDNISGGREYGKKHFQKTQKSVSEAEGERRSLHKRPRNPACTAERRRGTRCDGENCKR